MAQYKSVGGGENLWDLYAEGAIPFSVYSWSPTQLTVHTGDGTIIVLSGSGITYDENGPLFGGLVTTIRHYARDDSLPGMRGKLIDGIYDLSVPLSDIYNMSYLSELFAGNDTITSFSPEPSYLRNDRIHAGTGNDNVNVGNGADYVFAGSGEDTVFGGSGDDWLEGQLGSDTMYGGAGTDNLHGGQGDDDLYGQDGADWIDGGNTDWPDVASGNDTLRGGAGDDLIFGRDGTDLLIGGLDNDKLYGGSGNDVLRGQDGDDLLDGGEYASSNIAADEDKLYGGNGNDILLGRDGIDFLSGGADNDVIAGGTGNDILIGGAGDDLISGDGGNDRINGGDGQDAVFILENFEDLTFAIDSGRTIITTASGEQTVLQGVETIYTLSGLVIWNDYWQEWSSWGEPDHVIARNQDYYFQIGSSLDAFVLRDLVVLATYGTEAGETIYGHDYNDFIVGNEGDDTLLGGRAHDTLAGGFGDDFLDGSDGTDTAVFGLNFAELVISQDADGFIVSSSEGTDLLRSIEQIETFDGLFAWGVGLGNWQQIL